MRVSLCLAAMLLLITSTLSVQAQNNLLLPLPDGGVLHYGDDWAIGNASGTFEKNELKMTSDDKKLLIWVYYIEAKTLADDDVVTLIDFVAQDYALYNDASDQPFRADAVIVDDYDGVEIAQYTFQKADPDFPYDITLLYRLLPSGAGLSIAATSYAELEVGDISSLYPMLASYQPAGEVKLATTCEVTLPAGLVLRAATSVTSNAIRTIGRAGEQVEASLIRLDDNSAPWYFLAADQAYARVIVAADVSPGCALLPRTRR